MPEIRNDTNRTLSLADFNFDFIDVAPGGSIDSPYFYNDIGGATVVNEEPYYQDISQYLVASGTSSVNYESDIDVEIMSIRVCNSTDNNVFVYLNSITTNPYVVMNNSSFDINNISDRVKRVVVSFEADVTSGVYLSCYKSKLY